MGRLIDADVFMGNIVSIADLRTISTKTSGEALDKTPTVDAVPVVHGKWIYEERDRLDHETDDGRVFRTEKWWKCSKCGNAKGYIGHKPSDKFCSECGADMREDGDHAEGTIQEERS